MADILNIGNNNQNQLDSLINAFRATFDDQTSRLENQKNELERKSAYFNALNGRLNSIISQLDRFERDDAADNFTRKKVTSSNSEYVTASANGESIDGINTIKVSQLASNDRLLSGQINPDDSFGGISGAQIIEFTINGEVQPVEVVFEGTETNSEALTKIVDAINDSEIGISAGLVNQSDSSQRFTLRSNSTGEDGKIDFADNAIFTQLGLTREALSMDEPGGNRIQQTGNNAGFQKASPSELNSIAEINGVEISRSTNEINDVLTGVTFNLLKVQEADDSEITLNIEVNPESVKNFIDPFISAYNQLTNFLNSDRSMLRSDAAISSLRFQLRNTLTSQIEGVEDGDPEFLTNFGINIQSDGTLRFNDTEAIEDLLETNTDAVSNFFLGENGFFSRIQDVIERVKGDGNDLVKDRTLDLSSQIDRQDQRIENLQARIDRQAEAQREQYTTLLETFFQAQQQFSTFNNVSQQLGF